MGRLSLFLFALGWLSGAPMPCPTLATGQTLRGRVSQKSPACFLVVVQDGEATQLSVGQSVDLALRLTGSVVAVVDGFDFGAETLTIVLPGKYRIEVRNIDPL